MAEETLLQKGINTAKDVGGGLVQGGKITGVWITALLRIMLVMLALIAVLSLLGCAVTGLVGGNTLDNCGLNAATNMLQIGGNLLGFAAAIFDGTLTRNVLRAGELLQSRRQTSVEHGHGHLVRTPFQATGSR